MAMSAVKFSIQGHSYEQIHRKKYIVKRNNGKARKIKKFGFLKANLSIIKAKSIMKSKQVRFIYNQKHIFCTFKLVTYAKVVLVLSTWYCVKSNNNTSPLFIFRQKCILFMPPNLKFHIYFYHIQHLIARFHRYLGSRKRKRKKKLLIFFSVKK